METIKIKIPQEYCNKLNNFYMDNFGYDIHTQVQNFIFSELKKCGDASSDEVEPMPRPIIEKNYSIGHHPQKYILMVRYPDNSSLQIFHDDYELLMKIWNEWSKYSFKKEAKEKALLRYLPDRIRNLNVRRNKYELGKQFGNKKLTFGRYDDIDDALEVKHFLEEHDWDLKYHHTNLIGNIEGCNIKNYSDFLLKIVKGEMEL